MDWIFLFLAGVFEVVWAVCLKYCDGFKPTFALFYNYFWISFEYDMSWTCYKNYSNGYSVCYMDWYGGRRNNNIWNNIFRRKY